MRGVTEVILGATLWSLLVPLLGPIFVVCLAYRKIVIFFASIFRKDLLPISEQILVGGSELEETRDWNLFSVLVVELKGHLDIKVLREHVQSSLINCVDMGYLFTSDIVSWGGYVFAKRVKKNDIRSDLHVREIFQDDMKNSAEDTLRQAAMDCRVINENRLPPWEILLINQNSGKCSVMLKFHHTLADGKMAIQIANKMFGIKEKTGGKGTKKTASLLAKLTLFLKSPYIYFKHDLARSDSLTKHPFGSNHPWKSAPKTAAIAHAKIDFRKVKDISRKMRVRVLPVLACLQTEALKRFCLSKKVSLMDPRYIVSCILPGTSDKPSFGNNWTEAFVVVPLDEPDLLVRLQRTNSSFEEIENDGMAQINTFVFFHLFSIIPHRFLKVFHTSYQSAPHNAALSALVYTPCPLPSFKGLRVETISFFGAIKPEQSIRGYGITTITYGNEMSVHLGGTKDMFKDEHDINLYRTEFMNALKDYISVVKEA